MSSSRTLPVWTKLNFHPSTFLFSDMDIPTWSAYLVILTALNTTAFAVAVAASCRYFLETQYMDCHKVKFMSLQAGKYPLNITSVRILNLWNTGVSELQGNVFSNLTDLEFLNLGNNLLMYLHSDLFSALSQLRSLDLSYNKIASLTDKHHFASQKNLLYLYLEGNQLTTLPADVLYPMVSLHRLYLSLNPFVCNCQLHPTMLWCQQKCLITEATCNVPANNTWQTWASSNEETCHKASETHSQANACSYACLYTKRYEMMDCRNIPVAPLKAGKAPLHLISLHTLNLRNTSLTEIEPRAFSQLKRLSVIHLNNNQLASLDYRIFTNLTELTFIDLSSNRLVSLPDDRLFASQAKLEILLLHNNRLTTLDVSVVKPLLSLNEFDLSRNSLECSCQLHAMFLWCKERDIHPRFSCRIAQNRFLTPWEGHNESRGCDAHVPSNPTANITSNGTLPSNITTFEDTNINHLQQGINISNHIEISGGNYSEIASPVILCLYTFTFYEKINCKNSHLGRLNVGKYPLNITTLDTLNLHNTGLTALEPHIFSQLRRLRVLYLSGNQLRKLDYRLIEILTELSLLDLSYNLLMFLPSDERIFHSQGKLETLALNNNQLTVLHVGLLKSLYSLRKLHLSENPFVCDCQLLPAVLFCERRYIYTDATCNRPQEFSGTTWEVLKEDDCGGHEQQDMIGNGILQTVLICLVLFCGSCGLLGLYCWWRRQASCVGHQGSRTYDDVGLTRVRETVHTHALVHDYTPILYRLPVNCATNEFTCNDTSAGNNISSQIYDYVTELEFKNVHRSLPISKRADHRFTYCHAILSNNTSSHAYDDVGYPKSEDCSYVLPDSA
jgi:Leucine-rich repeat (LRR) protein